MSIQLSDEQGKALEAEPDSPPRVVDPRTKRTYVLVEAQQYERIKALLEEELDIRAAYPFMDAVAADEGWNDPSMDIRHRNSSTKPASYFPVDRPVPPQ